MAHPDAATLLDAVEGFLREAEGALSGRLAFHAKVAGNVVALVARELRERPEEGEAEAYRRLLGIDEDLQLGKLTFYLCERLRDGRLDAATPGLVDTLLETAAARLAVDNPRFSTLARIAP